METRDGTLNQQRVEDEVLSGILLAVSELEKKYPNLNGTFVRTIVLEALSHASMDDVGVGIRIQPYSSNLLL